MTNKHEQMARNWFAEECALIIMQSRDVTLVSLTALLDAAAAEAVAREREAEGSYRALVDACHTLDLNANDIWGYASADSTTMDADDAHIAVEAMRRWGFNGLLACMSVIEGIEPIAPLCTDAFHEAWTWAVEQDISTDQSNRTESVKTERELAEAVAWERQRCVKVCRSVATSFTEKAAHPMHRAAWAAANDCAEAISGRREDNRKWLEWSESKGPGLEAYREQDQQILAQIMRAEHAEARAEKAERELAEARELAEQWRDCDGEAVAAGCLLPWEDKK